MPHCTLYSQRSKSCHNQDSYHDTGVDQKHIDHVGILTNGTEAYLLSAKTADDPLFVVTAGEEAGLEAYSCYWYIAHTHLYSDY